MPLNAQCDTSKGGMSGGLHVSRRMGAITGSRSLSLLESDRLRIHNRIYWHRHTYCPTSHQ
ncbi:MAG: hypothetical protein KME45_29975 [Stenomitos rutilans HA7619-LM2]|nr:hypothetical protein [Stenomitos rutilans HA7619-LM2]